MIPEFPGLLQPWGIAALALVALAAYLLAYRWHLQKPSRPRVHLEVAALALLALLTGGFFWRVLTERGIWMPAGGGDMASLYYPTYSYVATQIKAGSIPLWNPYILAGMPLAADTQTALFYPINWILYLFFDVRYETLEWLLIIHYWLAAAFMYLFLRDIGQKRPGALAGGVAFAFCGFMTAHFGHLPMIPTATWIPLVLLSLRHAYVKQAARGWQWAIAAGLFLAMSLLAGHVQVFSYGLIAAGLFWLYLLLGRKPVTIRSATPWVLKGALAVAIALGIGAVQLLPSIELSSQSSRATVSYEEASEFPAQPVTLLNVLLPRVYGSNPTNYAFGDWQTTENWGYCGVVTIALATAGLALRRKRMVGFFAAIVALAFIVMVGDLSIVGAWMYKFLPGFNKLRDSGRALLLLGFGLAGLAGFGLDALISSLARTARSGTARRSAFWWLVGLSGMLAIAALGVMPALYKEAIVVPGAQYGRLPGAINDLGMLILWLGLLAGASWATYRGSMDAALMGALVLGLLVLDLFSPNSTFNPTTSDLLTGYRNYDAINSVYANTRDKRTNIPLRFNSDTDVPNLWQPSTALWWAGQNFEKPIYDTGGAYNPLQLQRYEYVWQSAKRNPDTPLYDLTGAGMEVISPTLTHQGQPKWVLQDKYTGFNLYKNLNAVPRAYLVHESRVEPDPQRLVEVIRNFDVDPRHTVVLESGAPVTSKLPGTAEPGNEKAGAESVRATRYTPNAVDISIKATDPGWLVLTDAWYPGWQATVDGRSVPIEPAYYAYRAVRVEPGEHTVSMQFRPSSWIIGRAVSPATLLIALISLVLLSVAPRLAGLTRRSGEEKR